MSSSAVQSFTDPYDYATSIRGTKAELTVIGRGDFAAKIIRIDFDQLWMQRFSENLPRILHSANSNGRTVVSFQTHAGPPLVRGGIKVRRLTGILTWPYILRTYVQWSGPRSERCAYAVMKAWEWVPSAMCYSGA